MRGKVDKADRTPGVRSAEIRRNKPMVPAVIGAATALLLAIIGGIIWIVREFGKSDKRVSLLEQKVEHLEHLISIYEVDARRSGPRASEIERFETRRRRRSPYA